MTEDKYAARRAARRAAAGQPAGQTPERPSSLQLAFMIWVIIGIPLIIGVVGIVIVLAAFNLRAGYRGARVWLTFFGLLAGLTLVRNLAVVIPGVSDITALGALVLVISTVISGAMLVATFAMWRAEVTEYMRILREGR